MEKQELVKNVSKWGNSAGILLPKKWMGKEVKITLIDRTSEIQKEVFTILSGYLEDIMGLYLVGSYARSEQRAGSDIDIIAISKSIRKEIISGKYHLSIVPAQSIKNAIQKNPLSILPRLIDAKPILNSQLLEELKSPRITKDSFKNFIEETRRIIRINKEIIGLDKLDGEYLKSSSVVYSLILRIRGVFILKTILENKKYSNKSFLKWLSEKIEDKNIHLIYDVYSGIRDNKKVGTKIELEKVEKLLYLLEKEIKKW